MQGREGGIIRTRQVLLAVVSCTISVRRVCFRHNGQEIDRHLEIPGSGDGFARRPQSMLEAHGAMLDNQRMEAPGSFGHTR